MALALLIIVTSEEEHTPFPLPRSNELEGFYQCVLHFSFLFVVFSSLKACAKEEEVLDLVVVIAYKKIKLSSN